MLMSAPRQPSELLHLPDEPQGCQDLRFCAKLRKSNGNSEPYGLRNDAMFPKHRSATLGGTVSPLCSFGETVGGVFASRYADSTCNDDRVAKGGLKSGKTVSLGKTVVVAVLRVRMKDGMC